MKQIRIEKPKSRVPRELEPILPLDPRDPDVVRVKRGFGLAVRRSSLGLVGL